MNHLQCLLEDIYANKFRFIWNVIQISIVCIVLTFILQSVGSYTDQKNKLQHMTEAGEIYMFKDHTTDEQMDELLSGTEQQKKIQKLYQYARKALEKAGDGKEWIADSSEAFMLTDELQIKYKDVIPFDSDQGVAEVKKVAVSPNFFQVYNIKYEGELKAGEKGLPPVVLGDKYRSLYKTGDTIRGMDGEDYRVTGFVNPGEYYIAPGESRDPYYLDDSMIVLAETDAKDVVSILKYFQAVYVTGSKKQAMQEICRYAGKNKILRLGINNFSYQMHAITVDLSNILILYGGMALLFFAFCIVSMTGSILHFLLEFRKELAVHRMVGADEKSVILRTLMPLWTAYVAVAVILVAVCGFGAESVCAFVIMVCYMILLSLVPVRMLRKTTICQMRMAAYE